MQKLDLIEIIDLCSKEWRQLIELLAKQHGLTFLEWRLLTTIVAAKQIEQQVLCRHLNILNNNVITKIDTLVKKGYVKKTIKPQDRKIRILAITKKKEAIVKQIKKLNDQLTRSCLAKFKKQDLIALENNLYDTLEGLQKTHDKFI